MKEEDRLLEIGRAVLVDTLLEVSCIWKMFMGFKN